MNLPDPAMSARNCTAHEDALRTTLITNYLLNKCAFEAAVQLNGRPSHQEKVKAFFQGEYR